MANPIRFAVNAATSTFAAGPLGAAKSLTGLRGNTIAPGSLSARVYWSILTDTITITGKWQGSTDNSTWRDIVPANNAAHVVLQTSTGTGAKYIEAPVCVGTFPWVRFSVVSGVASGTSGDTVTMSYNYTARQKFDGYGVYGV